MSRRRRKRDARRVARAMAALVRFLTTDGPPLVGDFSPGAVIARAADLPAGAPRTVWGLPVRDWALEWKPGRKP